MLGGGGWLRPPPRHFTPGKETRYPLYKRLGGPRGQSGWSEKTSPPPGFIPWTIHPAMSHYTDYAIPASCLVGYNDKCLKIWHVSIFYRPSSCKCHIFMNFLSNLTFNSYNILHITLKWKWLFMFLVVDPQMYVAPLFGFSPDRNSKYALPLNL